MNHYELLYILPLKYSENELPEIIAKINSLIKKTAAVITKEDNWGKKKLAYPIKQNHHGYFIINEIDIAPENIQKLSRELLNESKILRHQITQFKPESIEPNREIKLEETETSSSLAQPRHPSLTTKALPKISLDAKKLKEKDISLENIKEKSEIAKDKKGKVALEDLDKKLEEILSDENLDT